MTTDVRDVHTVQDGMRFRDDGVLVAVTCPHCFMIHAIPERLNNAARAWPGDQPRGWTIHCPMGHSWVYKGRTLEQKLGSVQDALARERANLDQARASLRSTRGAATRARNERDRLKAHASAGVCPVDGCHRHFTNLERHISTKHPDFKGETT